jgi:glycosyltransferase involved in cell wall biosynthesis
MRVDLLWLSADGAPAPAWPLGRVLVAPPLARAWNEASARCAVPFLSWDANLGAPDPQRIAALLELPGDVLHAGLLLGQAGRPALFDFVHPTWMLNRDPPTDIVASSWRLSLRAALVRTEAPGRLAEDFEDFDLAALELGHRWLWQGLILRHVPALVPSPLPSAVPEKGREKSSDLVDQVRFLKKTCGSKWTWWALWRAWRCGLVVLGSALAAWRLTRLPGVETPGYRSSDVARRSECTERQHDGGHPRVTILIPTLDRYPYLDVLLEQLRHQTVPAHEIVIVDQSQNGRRRDWSAFADLPLRVLEIERPGQCSSRNAGLEIATGDFVLFIDDDDEVAPDLLARHLDNLSRQGAAVSCGVADEKGAGPLPPGFGTRRLSDVFPTNNSMVAIAALTASGLFDLAYDRGARADADLGMRLYLSGALMVLDPAIRVFHHHAPAGGLRRHGARAITYAASRQSLLIRHLPSPTEIYLTLRYFDRGRVEESLQLRAAGTLAVRGGCFKRWLKVMFGLLLWPSTWRSIRKSQRLALEMLARFPQIGVLDPPSNRAARPS